jgi:RNA-binding protein
MAAPSHTSETTLSAADRRALRTRGNSLRPLVQIGKNGFGPQQIAFIQDALRTRDLVKIRLLDNTAVSRQELASALIAAIPGGAIAGTIGHTLLLYCPIPDEEKA